MNTDAENQRMQFSSEDEEEEIDLLGILKALWKKLPILIVVAIAATLLGYFGSSMLLQETFRTSFTLYVNSRTDEYGANSNLTSSDISAARSLADTYAQIIQGRAVLTEAASRCGLDSYKYEDLQNMVEANTDSNTEIITVYVTGTSPENALYFAQSIAQVAEGKLAEVVDGSSMRVIDEPNLPTEKYRPRNTFNALIVGAAAVFLVSAIIVIRFLLDDRVKDEESLEEKYGYSVIGSIPNMESAKRAGSDYYGYGDKKSRKRRN